MPGDPVGFIALTGRVGLTGLRLFRLGFFVGKVTGGPFPAVSTLGREEGEEVGVGNVGDFEGWEVGCFVDDVGKPTVGEVGVPVGAPVGAWDGTSEVGAAVGAIEGWEVGCCVNDVGNDVVGEVGDPVGPFVGAVVGVLL
jgi:hypothetical protein